MKVKIKITQEQLLHSRRDPVMWEMRVENPRKCKVIGSKKGCAAPRVDEISEGVEEYKNSQKEDNELPFWEEEDFNIFWWNMDMNEHECDNNPFLHDDCE